MHRSYGNRGLGRDRRRMRDREMDEPPPDIESKGVFLPDEHSASSASKRNPIAPESDDEGATAEDTNKKSTNGRVNQDDYNDQQDDRTDDAPARSNPSRFRSDRRKSSAAPTNDDNAEEEEEDTSSNSKRMSMGGAASAASAVSRLRSRMQQKKASGSAAEEDASASSKLRSRRTTFAADDEDTEKKGGRRNRRNNADDEDDDDQDHRRSGRDRDEEEETPGFDEPDFSAYDNEDPEFSLSARIAAGGEKLEEIAGTAELPEPPLDARIDAPIVPFSREKLRMVQKDMDSVPRVFFGSPAEFDHIPFVMDILSSNNRERKLGELLRHFTVADRTINSLVTTYYTAFSASIRYFSQMVTHMDDSKQMVSQLRTENAARSKDVLSAEHHDLRALWLQSVHVSRCLQILQQVQELCEAPVRIREALDKHEFRNACAIVLSTLSALESPDLFPIRALRDLRDEMREVREEIVERLTGHLQKSIFTLPPIKKASSQSRAASLFLNETEMEDEIEALRTLGRLDDTTQAIAKTMRGDLRGVILQTLRECCMHSRSEEFLNAEDEDEEEEEELAEQEGNGADQQNDHDQPRVHEDAQMEADDWEFVVGEVRMLPRFKPSNMHEKRLHRFTSVVAKRYFIVLQRIQKLVTAITSPKDLASSKKRTILSKDEIAQFRPLLSSRIQDKTDAKDAKDVPMLRALRQFRTGFLERPNLWTAQHAIVGGSDGKVGFLLQDMMSVFEATLKAEYLAQSKSNEIVDKLFKTDVEQFSELVRTCLAAIQSPTITTIGNSGGANVDVFLQPRNVWFVMQIELQSFLVELFDTHPDAIIVSARNDAETSSTGGGPAQLRFSFQESVSKGGAENQPPTPIASPGANQQKSSGGQQNGAGINNPGSSSGVGRAQEEKKDKKDASFYRLLRHYAPPSVYNLLAVYIDLSRFAAKCMRLLDVPGQDTRVPHLQLFLDTFAQRIFLPRLKLDAKLRCDRILVKSMDAFRAREASTSSTSSTGPISYVTLPHLLQREEGSDNVLVIDHESRVVPGLLSMWELVYVDLWGMCSRLPPFSGDIVHTVVEPVLEMGYREAFKKCQYACGDSLGWELAGDVEVLEMLRSDPFYAFLPDRLFPRNQRSANVSVAGSATLASLASASTTSLSPFSPTSSSLHHLPVFDIQSSQGVRWSACVRTIRALREPLPEDAFSASNRNIGDSIDMTLAKSAGGSRTRVLGDGARIHILASLAMSLRWISAQLAVFGTRHAYVPSYDDGLYETVRDEFAQASFQSNTSMNTVSRGFFSARQAWKSSHGASSATSSVVSPSVKQQAHGSNAVGSADARAPGGPSISRKGSDNSNLSSPKPPAAPAAQKPFSDRIDMMVKHVLPSGPPQPPSNGLVYVGHFLDRFPRLKKFYEDFADLADRCLFTLKIDMRARCMFSIKEQLEKGASFFLEEVPSEPDDFVVHLNRDLQRVHEQLLPVLPAAPAGNLFLVAGLAELVCSVFRSAVRNMEAPQVTNAPARPLSVVHAKEVTHFGARFNQHGLQKIERDIFALQQNLIAMTGATMGLFGGCSLPGGPSTESGLATPFDRLRQYYKLLEIADPQELFNMISEQGPEFSMEEYKAILMSETHLRPRCNVQVISSLETLFSTTKNFSAPSKGSLDIPLVM